MAELVGTPGPTKAIPAAVLNLLSRWNESLLHMPWLHGLRIKPGTISSPWLVTKMTQDQSTKSTAAQSALGYRPRPLRQMLERNYDWLVKSGRLLKKDDNKPKGKES
jgi:hypothetical protein